MKIPAAIKKKILTEKPCYFEKSFSKIFSWEELERLLNLRPFVNSTRFKIINQKGYSWNNQAWLSDVNAFPPSLLKTELQENHCYFSDCSRVNSNINDLCGELEKTFPRSAVDAHIYFTISKNLKGGFGIHWDFSHNLIVQVEGSTRFELWDYYADQNTTERSVESLPIKPTVDVIMKPGDAVFVPLRSYHRATSQTKRLSVSFPISFNNENESQDRTWIKI